MNSDIWFLLGLTLFSLFGILFFIIALNDDELWRKIVYLAISLPTSVVAGLFWMITLIDLGPVFMFFFTFLGLIDIALIAVFSVQSYNLKYPSRNRRYRPTDE